MRFQTIFQTNLHLDLSFTSCHLMSSNGTSNLYLYPWCSAQSLEHRKSESLSVMSDSLWPHGLYSPWSSPGQNIGVGSLSLLQGIFPTQGSHPGLPYCRRILYQGSPRILEWVAYPFSSRSSLPRNWTWVSCIAGGFFNQLSYLGSLNLC